MAANPDARHLRPDDAAEGATMRPGQARKAKKRLEAAKRWQEEERAAARGRIIEMAETTAEYDPHRDEQDES